MGHFIFAWNYMEIVENEEYDTLPENASIYVHMGAGAMAGIMEHCVLYPVDSVKTRMQSLRLGKLYRNPYEALVKIVNQDARFNPVRGLPAIFVGAGVSHALYYACYENVKHQLEKYLISGPIAHGIAGCTAAVFHYTVMNPAEVVKQRMQMFGSPYQNSKDCLLHTLQREGPRAFYRSYPTQLAISVPFHGAHFVLYEMMQDLLNKERTYAPVSHLISGATAGAAAAALTTPLDVCKTLLNTQELRIAQGATPIENLRDAFKLTYQSVGFKGFFQGLHARLLLQMCGRGISWTVYEFFKFVLCATD